MRKVLKIAGIAILVLILGLAACIPLGSSPRPEGAVSPQADELARTMTSAINIEAWNNVRYVSWNFLGQHDFLWDKYANRARVDWGKYRVYIDGGTLEGRAFKKDMELSGKDKEKAMTAATEHFFNDAFWLNAPSKVFDEGVIRSTVELKNGQTGLLVTYSSGGTTPGDAYLWTIGEDGMPEHWKMWTQVLPVKGLGTSWEGWMELEGGAKISTVHGAGPANVTMIRELKSGPSLTALGEAEDALAERWFQPFAP